MMAAPSPRFSPSSPVTTQVMTTSPFWGGATGRQPKTERISTTEQEEWLTSRKKQHLVTKQIETRVQREVLLDEDGNVVSSSEPEVTSKETEDVKTNETEMTEHKKNDANGRNKQLLGSEWKRDPKSTVVTERVERRSTKEDSREEMTDANEETHIAGIPRQVLFRSLDPETIPAIQSRTPSHSSTTHQRTTLHTSSQVLTPPGGEKLVPFSTPISQSETIKRSLHVSTSAPLASTSAPAPLASSSNSAAQQPDHPRRRQHDTSRWVENHFGADDEERPSFTDLKDYFQHAVLKKTEDYSPGSTSSSNRPAPIRSTVAPPVGAHPAGTARRPVLRRSQSVKIADPTNQEVDVARIISSLRQQPRVHVIKINVQKDDSDAHRQRRIYFGDDTSIRTRTPPLLKNVHLNRSTPSLSRPSPPPPATRTPSFPYSSSTLPRSDKTSFGSGSKKGATSSVWIGGGHGSKDKDNNRRQQFMQGLLGSNEGGGGHRHQHPRPSSASPPSSSAASSPSSPRLVYINDPLAFNRMSNKSKWEEAERQYKFRY